MKRGGWVTQKEGGDDHEGESSRGRRARCGGIRDTSTQGLYDAKNIEAFENLDRVVLGGSVCQGLIVRRGQH